MVETLSLFLLGGFHIGCTKKLFCPTSLALYEKVLFRTVRPQPWGILNPHFLLFVDVIYGSPLPSYSQKPPCKSIFIKKHKRGTRINLTPSERGRGATRFIIRLNFSASLYCLRLKVGPPESQTRKTWLECISRAKMHNVDQRYFPLVVRRMALRNVTRWEWKCWRGCVYPEASSAHSQGKSTNGSIPIPLEKAFLGISV